MGDKLPNYSKVKGSAGVKGSGQPKVVKSGFSAIPFAGKGDSRPSPGEQNQSAKK